MMMHEIARRMRVCLLAIAGMMSAQTAHAAIYDVTMGGQLTGIRFGSFSALPPAVSSYLQPSDPFSAVFTLDVTGNTINSISGSMDLDGLTGAVTAFSLNSGGSGFRGFSLQFDELATGTGFVGGVSIDDLSFRMPSLSGQTFEQIFDSALSNASAIYRTSVTAQYRSGPGSYSNHYGVFDSDGAVSLQSVSLSTVPVPAGLLLMITGMAGLLVLTRRRRPSAR
ncbi:MAG: VPLPA-CTERM sorting domain-containing protein [Pseudomonadota bacterium]